ncbi:hypothetical protein [Sphingomonas sp. NFR15]|uniref:hypothetical protein n=1 Tax=Sphingomonas sp. NFR15 TaxID=1566282 RepID=UPI0008901C95|nr:hypothetical protein [Sphingomonas sp. NFR15]SDA15735.1 hypothetical protein SAMN03159340_00742 [Sphingomonas sp. NFR15]
MTAEWDGAAVRTWLARRIASARAEQVRAERGGYEFHDDCDKAAAEEMVCAALKDKASVDAQSAFAEEVRALLARDDYIWRGVYDDTRFDRHVRSYLRKLAKMTKTNVGFGNVAHYQ